MLKFTAQRAALNRTAVLLKKLRTRAVIRASAFGIISSFGLTHSTFAQLAPTISSSMVFPTDPARETVSPVRNFIAFPTAKRAAHRHTIPHKPARDHPHHQPSHQHRHQRGDLVELQLAPKEPNEPAKDSASNDRPKEAENKMTRGTHAAQNLSLHHRTLQACTHDLQRCRAVKPMLK